MSIRRCIFLFVVAATVIGCSPRLYPARDVQQTRTVLTEIHDRDTLVVLRPDSALVSARVICTSEGIISLRDIRVTQSSSRFTVKIDISDSGILTARAVVDSLPVLLSLKDRKTTELVDTRETVTQAVEVNVLRWWQKALMWLGAAMLILIIIKAVKIIINMRLNGVQSILSILTKIK